MHGQKVLRDRDFYWTERLPYLDLGDILKGNGEYTLNGWINVENTEGSQVIVGRERDSYDSWKWKLYIEDGQLKFSMNNGKGAYPGHEADGEIVMLLESGQSVVEAGKWQQLLCHKMAILLHFI